MKIHNVSKRFAVAGLVAATAFASSGAFAATGGGATIHNAATLSYNSGQQVTDWVNVDVLTIGTAPTIELLTTGPFTVNAGDTVSLTYAITSNSNGYDSYSLATTTSTTTGMTAGTTFTPSTNAVTLGASITAAPSAVVDGDTGTVFIPAGSETNLAVNDVVVLNGFTYLVEAIRAGTVASTIGNATTAEVFTEVDLTVPPASGSPSIGAATISTGTQFGEQDTFTVDVTVTAPTVVGVDGDVDPAVSGNTSALDTSGNPVDFDTAADADPGNDVTITVLSATVTILKEASNITKGIAFASTGVNAQTGDVLEYRITMTVNPTSGDTTDSILRDSIPPYTTYVASSTTLNGVAVADDGGADAFPLSPANGGLGVNSVNGTADQVNGGVLVDGDTGADAATIVFRVTVD
jgi:hypothetical protein